MIEGEEETEMRVSVCNYQRKIRSELTQKHAHCMRVL